MTVIFYIAAVIAILSTLMVITRKNAVHALLYLVVSLLSAAVIFYILGAPFIAALEVIIYAGAIMVLFIFVIMLLNVTKESEKEEKKLLSPGMWIGPGIMGLILLFDFAYVIITLGKGEIATGVVGPKEVGLSLFTTYMIGVELAALLLLAGLVGAFHLGRKSKKVTHRYLDEGAEE
jgi:NADH-quinone oxidoreductase subunit J